VRDAAPGWSPARLAYGFYTVAATGAVIGQTWVALTHIPWGTGIPGWVRVAAVLPFALCLELLATALAAMADQRMRLGEHAYGFRVFSALVATVAVGILVVGHWPHYYWSAAFGVLSTSAYLLWLLHSGARRRDALRAAGKLADTAPDYGLWRRLRYPIWTARAAELAREGHTDPATGAWRPLTLYESLRAAQLAIRANKRRPALARAVEQVVRTDHPDPQMADIAVRTLDLDQIATELETRVDYAAWADRLAPAITVPATPQREHHLREPRVPATSAPGTVGHPARGRRLRVVVRRAPDADRVTRTPITRAGAAALAPVPAGGSGRPEPPHNGAPVATGTADTVPGLPVRSPSSDHTDPAIADRTVADRSVVGGAGTGGAGVEDGVPDSGDLAGTEPDTAGIPSAALSETATAVAYWRERYPHLRPTEIAARVGKSERQVRRILATLDDIGVPAPDGAAVADLADAHR